MLGAQSISAGPVAAWIVGFAVYHWLHNPPLSPSWWVALVERTDPPALGIGASLPSFGVAFALAAAVGLRTRRTEAASATA